MLSKSKTSIGYGCYNFKDQCGVKCSMQKSSLNDNAIWLGVDDPEPKMVSGDGSIRAHRLSQNIMLNTRMHLTVKQVEELLPILQKFVKTGEI